MTAIEGREQQRDGSGSNLLLACISERERERLLAHGSRVSFAYRDTLDENIGRTTSMILPLRGALSIVHIGVNGEAVEVAIVGTEGVIGLSEFFRGPANRYRMIAQAEGEAFRIPVAAFSREFHRGGALCEVVLRYASTYMHQLAQSAVCNRLHTIEHRLAKWLLLVSQRTGINDLQASQEYLSLMLGARRASVNEIIQRFKECGALIHTRNRIRLVDKRVLAARSCDCYQALSTELDSLFEWKPESEFEQFTPIGRFGYDGGSSDSAS